MKTEKRRKNVVMSNVIRSWNHACCLPPSLWQQPQRLRYLPCQSVVRRRNIFHWFGLSGLPTQLR